MLLCDEILCLSFIFSLLLRVWLRSTDAPLNEDYQHWIDRYEVKAGKVAPEMFTAIKPYKRKAIVSFSGLQ